MYRPRSLLGMTRDSSAVTQGKVNAVPSGSSATASASGKNGKSATADTGSTPPSLAANAAGSVMRCMNGSATKPDREQRLTDS